MESLSQVKATEQKTSRELLDLTSAELLEKLDELKHHTLEAGEKLAEAERKFKDLKELMPSVLAEYQAHYCEGANVSISTARMRALADKRYQARIKEMNIAEYEARLKEVEYKAYMESIKAITAIAYTRNSELKLAR